LNINLVFYIKNFKINKQIIKHNFILYKSYTPQLDVVLKKSQMKKPLKKLFLKKSVTSFRIYKFIKKLKKINFLFFLNKFLIGFLENFFKLKIVFNLKKGSNKLLIKQISFRKFSLKYFKKNLKTSKQIIGVLYYSFLLKDSSIFVNFFKKILEKINLKLHKKMFLGLKKLIKDLFKPMFRYFGLLGVFFNIKGKIGVSGSAKKRRYYFNFGKHSITTRLLKVDYKHTPV
jgi:hypothetical protein